MPGQKRHLVGVKGYITNIHVSVYLTYTSRHYRYVQQDAGLDKFQPSRECPILQDLPRPQVWPQGIRLWRWRCWPEHGHRIPPRVSVAALTSFPQTRSESWG